jgi:acyl-coenzyme A synthetase/AMP-(fatty) acid ligase
MQQLLDSPLAAAAAHLDRPAVIDGGRTWTWRQVHEASLALAGRLGDASAVCNLCVSRVGFLVTCLAALRRRSLLVLPPSGGNAELTAVLQAAARPVVVGDPHAWPEAWCDERSTPYVSCQPDWPPAGASAEALAWQPAWDETALLLYTSGSTGAPEPQAKTLLHLARGALVLGVRLEAEVEGGLAAIGRIVCSVLPQHMFGLECSVMLPLVHGIPVLDKRPLLPADVRAAFAGAPAGAWIATPMHLRSLVQSAVAVPSCCVVIASTMPLTQAVARQSEQLVQAPVLEIYGSTETGALAMRRTARGTAWRPMDGVQLEAGDDAMLGRGSHFASPVKLLDELLLEPDGTFTLLGRQSDLVKIAGRRASLAGLDLMLQDLPGLEDGVFYLPATGNPTERLCLIHSGPPLDRAATRRWLRERLDPVFLPRAFIRVDRLPRGDNGKLRRPALDRLFAEWQSALPPSAPRPVPAKRRVAVS